MVLLRRYLERNNLLALRQKVAAKAKPPARRAGGFVFLTLRDSYIPEEVHALQLLLWPTPITIADRPTRT